MKTRATGIVIIVIGIMMTVYTGFNYVTTEKVVDLGPIEINKKENHPLQWKPVLGMLIVAVGGILVIKAGRTKSE
ncbi:hypothetical protein [Flavobacterium limnophilum]|uniref:hypothetical protein n=1 Tax=Flavobacterium limnophilum TaxID=3003262 RepID=UPI0024827CD6|nr:hypothetical protein [Flavobacterium limnophilum]